MLYKIVRRLARIKSIANWIVYVCVCVIVMVCACIAFRERGMMTTNI